MSFENSLPEVSDAARRVVDGGIPAQMPESGSELPLREVLTANTDWRDVLEQYLNQGQQADGAPRSPIDALPTVIGYLRGDDQPHAQEAARAFYGHLESNGLLASPDVRANNVHLSEAASQEPPMSTASLMDYRQTQTGRIGHYVGEYRIDLGNLRTNPHITAVRHLADLVAPATGRRLAGQLETARSPVDPGLAPLDAQLSTLATQLIDEDGGLYRDPIPPESLTIAIEGDQTQLSHLSMTPEGFRRMCDIAVHSYPSALMAGHTRFELLKSDRHQRKTGHVEFDEDGAIVQLWPDAITESSTTGNPDTQPQDTETRLTALVEEVLDHELAHVVHSNAPVKWLRKWDDMLQRGVSLRELSTMTRGVDDARPVRSHEDGQRRKAEEQMAEAIQTYRNNPVRLLEATNSLEPFMLLQELLHGYSDEVVAEQLTGLQLPLNDNDAQELRRRFAEDRQNVLRANLEEAGIWPTRE